MRARILVAALMSCLGLFLASPVLAHPLGNFTINHLVKARLSGEDLKLRYVLDIAEIPTFQIMRQYNGAAAFRDIELQDWARSQVPQAKAGLLVSEDGKPLRLTAGTPRAMTRPGAGGLPTLYFSVDFDALLARPHNGRLSIDDRTFPNRIGWKDVVVAPATEPTSELRRYPNALLSSPRNVTFADVKLGYGLAVVRTGSLSDSGRSTAPSQIRTNKLSDMLARGTSNPFFVLLTLLIAAGLGALHAIEPGHGKTLLAVSLVGARATARQAVILATGLTFAHTAGVIALGVVLLFASQWMVPENVYPWITVTSGMVVAALGANALARFMRLRRGEQHAHDAAHHHHHDAENGVHDAHAHSHVLPGTKPLSFRGVVLMAMSGNIAPCPAALVVLLTALSLHQVAYGIVVIIAFSIGLSGVLTTMGIAFVRGAKWLSERPAFEHLTNYGPLASACVIACIGAIMIGQGFASGSLHAPVLPVTMLALAAIAGYALRPGHVHVHAVPS